jgi:hypothetical protein
MTKQSNAATLPASFEAMVAEAAYFKAQQRGFESGHELNDWLEAEHEVHALLSETGRPAVKRARKTTKTSNSTAPRKRGRSNGKAD